MKSLDPESPAVLRVPFLSAAWMQGAPTRGDFNALNGSGPGGLRERLTLVTDPRHRRGIPHAVDQVLVLALAAVLAGQRHYIALSDWIAGRLRVPAVGHDLQSA